MSEVYIHYGNLEDSIAQSKKVRSEISGYIEEIKRRVTTPISNLSGSDSSGYASTASSLAWQKISDLNAKASRYSSYESSISTLISTAKTKDNYVSSQIETISDMYLTERNWFQKAGDAIYNFFCVDLANKWGWIRTVSDVAKWVREKATKVADNIRDWFKYGDGKYVANILGAIGGAILAFAGLIAAIVSLPVTGTAAIIIGVASVILSAVTMFITFYNSEATIKGNIKALKLSHDENPGAARYYGNIKSLSDEWDKTDMGDASTNKAYDIAGDAIDTTKKIADTALFVLNIANLGVVKDFRYKPGEGNTGYSFTWDNIKRNILHDMNIYTSKIGKKGVKLLMCESTNVERPGYTMSESSVGQTLERIFLDNKDRRMRSILRHGLADIKQANLKLTASLLFQSNCTISLILLRFLKIPTILLIISLILANRFEKLISNWKK